MYEINCERSSLGNANDMISAGLYMNDLNLFDGTSELLVTSIHQTREIEDAIVKVSMVGLISTREKYQD
jgi:hypothetical protein